MVKLGTFVSTCLEIQVFFTQAKPTIYCRKRAGDKLAANYKYRSEFKDQMDSEVENSENLSQGGGTVESTEKAASVPQCRPAPYPTQSCNTAKCERREGVGGGAALCLLVQVGGAAGDAHYCSSRQWHRTFAPNCTARRERATRAVTEPTRWTGNNLMTVLFFQFYN